MNAVKSFIFLILVSGFAAIYAPIFLLTGGERNLPGWLTYSAIPFWLVGASIILWCFWTFTFYGQGTPAPIDPPKKLVAIGLYRYVRNPIYIGVLLILIGHVAWFGRINLLIYLLTAFLAFHLFVLLYEEPTLKKKFGKQYEAYFKKVPRWLPRFPKEKSRNG